MPEKLQRPRVVPFFYPILECGVASPYTFNENFDDSELMDDFGSRLIDKAKHECESEGRNICGRPLNAKVKSAVSAALADSLRDDESKPAPRTGSEMKRKLLGFSVEEAVHDKPGCRPRANSTDFELNLPRRGLCDERMVLGSHKWLHSWPGESPKGFENLGNTCYLNSTLQCLAHLPPFCQSLLTIPDKPKGVRPSQSRRVTFILKSLFLRVHNQSSSTSAAGAIAPHAIVKFFQSLGLNSSRSRGCLFRPGRQEDAHEFLVHLLEAMHDGELREAGINQCLIGWRDRLPVPRLDETTFIHRVFGGYLRSQLQCSMCNFCSNTFDPFLDLALEIDGKSITSISAAFQKFARVETLDCNNRWKCCGCGQYVRAKKALTVFRPPLALCLQMKRFAFTGAPLRTKRGSKVCKAISFPAELILPLSDCRSCPYALTGVVVHVGDSSNSGHYTAFVKSRGNSSFYEWYHVDDAHVQPVSEEVVLQQRNAYLLFYCRKEVHVHFPPPPMPGFKTSEESAMHCPTTRSEISLELQSQRPASAGIEGIGMKFTPTQIVTSSTEAEKAGVDDRSAKHFAVASTVDIASKPKAGNGSRTLPLELTPDGRAGKKSSPTNSVKGIPSLSESQTALNVKEKFSYEAKSHRSDFSGEDSCIDCDVNAGISLTWNSCFADVSREVNGSGAVPDIGDKSSESFGKKEQHRRSPFELSIASKCDSRSCDIAAGGSSKVSHLKRNLENAWSGKKNNIDKLPRLFKNAHTAAFGRASTSGVVRKSSSSSSDVDRAIHASAPKMFKTVGSLSTRNERSHCSSKGEDTSKGMPHATQEERTSGFTRIFSDGGNRRENVFVMMGPRYQNRTRWSPTSSGRTQNAKERLLIGNRAVGEWDNAAGTLQRPKALKVSKSRVQMVRRLGKRRIAQKGKSNLNCWDGALDGGRRRAKPRLSGSAVPASTTQTSKAFEAFLPVDQPVSELERRKRR